MSTKPPVAPLTDFTDADLDALATFPQFFSTDGMRWYMAKEFSPLCERAAAEIKRLRGLSEARPAPDREALAKKLHNAWNAQDAALDRSEPSIEWLAVANAAIAALSGHST